MKTPSTTSLHGLSLSGTLDARPPDRERRARGGAGPPVAPALPGFKALMDSTLVREALGGGRPWILALDYDGTMAPFTPDRDKAFPYPEITSLLRRLPITGPSRFLIVSGRDCHGVAGLLGLSPRPEIWGCHGMQRLLPDGRLSVSALTPAQERALEEARLAAGAGADVEVKPCSVALHWRGLDRQARMAREEWTRPVWEKLARRGGLALHDFDGGIELRRPGPGKGEAVLEIAKENPEAALFYLGDDLTDEDAFKALGPLGTGVLVRQKPRPTAASYHLTPPGGLAAFLAAFA